MAAIPSYAELRCVSNFSFLRGASQPEELVERAKQLGYSALALTDECSMAGVVRAHVAAKEQELKLLLGSQFQIEWGEAVGPDTTAFVLTALACNLNGYGNLCQFITKLRRSSEKGTYHLDIANIQGHELADCVVLASPQRMAEPAQLVTVAQWLLEHFIGRCWFGVDLLRLLTDEMWLHRLRQVSADSAIPLVAAGDVHFHVRSRKPLQDVMTATRIGKPLTECGLDLQPNAERHLRTRLRLAQTYPAELLAETLKVAERCDFSLDELRYQYPDEVVPAGETPASYLRRITYDGAGHRWPQGMPAKVQSQIEHELELIADLQYEHYFLTVADIVAFARSRHILCQGRGSAANSVVCYCIGVTEVDPARMSVLFERFISRERNEPPDIDIDFEHERREEVLQYLYAKYGRDRAAITGVVISYRPKSAIRDVGKALGFALETVDAIAKGHVWWDGREVKKERLEEVGLCIDDLKVQQLLHLTQQLLGFPRHLSQHTGGFVLTKGPLSRMVPIENASMPDRTVIEWDKDDLDALGLLKVDCLALGMLTAIRKSLDFIGRRKGYVFEMQDIPAEDIETYDMVCKADTVGVFQIESRAQMSMLPRLKPRCFYDLVVEVAIVRPGPIQGGMVHPYLRRRQGLEPVVYPRDEIRPALERTLGVPIFQEQVMQIAMLAAGFSGGEADALRRAMAAWRRKGGLEPFEQRVVDGMMARGYQREFAEAIFRQIQGFGEYGFPESHAASFALLVYVSSWIKRHEPAAFLAALLDSQPMGFYAPAQLVRDARAHGIEVRGVDVLVSECHSTLEARDEPDAAGFEADAGRGGVPAYRAPSDGSAIDRRAQPAVRLGLNRVRGLPQSAAERIVAARAARRIERDNEAFAFDSVEDLARQAQLDARALHALAQADALRALAGHRAQAHWEAAAIRPMPRLLAEARFDEAPTRLAPLSEGREIVADYRGLGIPMGRHPLALLRDRLARYRVLPAEALHAFPNGRLARASGLVTHRQRPDTAGGTLFVTLEDETGTVNVIVWADVFERHRREVLGAQLMTVYGTWQCDTETGGQVRHLLAHTVVDHSAWLGQLEVGSRDFR